MRIVASARNSCAGTKYSGSDVQCVPPGRGLAVQHKIGGYGIKYNPSLAMALVSGMKLGPYEVQSLLGSGGMGEVYRASDTRLGRSVAIKILPSNLSDPERLDRFEQEARSASALNHPNIITIHELGQDGSTHYIAMELVEGKTLRELLVSGLLPMRKAIEIAAQVAEGLTKAHEAGIAHRDLKPENVMVSHDGFVKILDFGLAKLASPGGETSDMCTASVTRAGLVLGTVQYMSPEQASGSQLDFRSDQFSFGLVLYEMVTGKRAFQRNTAAETMVAILREQQNRSGRKTPTPRLRCVGLSRGAWRKSPISATSLLESSHANLQPFATASPRSQLSRWRPARRIFLCSGPVLWGGRRK